MPAVPHRGRPNGHPARGQHPHGPYGSRGLSICSEAKARFKTLKYRPAFPARFDSIDHAREHCRQFFDWYNGAHRHSGIGLRTPAAFHHGQAPALHAARARVPAYERYPERFVRKPPAPPELPTAAWINKPEKEVAAQ